ncbi:RcnB family protein [Rhodobacteraceae bacterium KMM 6894]|nr:RcnB family protein [Rhodobacteraceae bacterium KMM 6894]
MKNLIGSGLIALIALTNAAPLAAEPSRVHHGRSHGKVIKVPAKQHHRHRVGHHFERNKILIVKDWKSHGLRRPRRGEVYVLDGADIYLAAAASLIVKALMN